MIVRFLQLTSLITFFCFLSLKSQIATYPLSEDLNDTTNSFHGSYNPLSCCEITYSDGQLIYGNDHCKAISDKLGFDVCGLPKTVESSNFITQNDEKFLKYSKEKIVEARDMLQDAVKENGLKPLSTSTNFMYVDLGSLNAEEFRKEMEKERVLIRGIYQDYVNWSRVSTGKIEDVKQYIKALPRVLDRMS